MSVDTRPYSERADYFRKRYVATRKKRLAAAKLRHINQREKKKEYDRLRYSVDPARYRAIRIEAGRRWEKSHPDRVLEKTRRRAAARIQRVPLWADHDGIRLIYRAADIAKITFPEIAVHVDHEIPLRGRRVSGLHVANNLRLTSAKENQRKGNRF